MVETHRVRSPEERRRLELARRRYARRYRRIEDLKRRGPQFVMVLLSLLAISLILYRLFGPELLKEEDEVISDTFVPPESELAADIRLDPELLRPELEAFERALFVSESARTLEDLSSAINVEAGALSERARALKEGRPRLAELEQGVEGISAELQRSSFNLETLAEIRSEWLAMRTQVLLRADWFVSPQSGFSEDASFQTAYRDAATSLFDLVETARVEAESFSEMVADGEKIDRDWRDFEGGFTEQLREIELSIPAERPGVKASIQLLDAIQKLERTVDFVRESVAIEVPGHPLNAGPYDRAVDSAQEVLDAFDAVEN